MQRSDDDDDKKIENHNNEAKNEREIRFRIGSWKAERERGGSEVTRFRIVQLTQKLFRPCPLPRGTNEFTLNNFTQTGTAYAFFLLSRTRKHKDCGGARFRSICLALI